MFDDKLSENITNSNIYAQIERDSSTGVKKVLSSRGFDKYLDGSFYNELINISQDSIKELTLLKKAYKNNNFKDSKSHVCKHSGSILSDDAHCWPAVLQPEVKNQRKLLHGYQPSYPRLSQNFTRVEQNQHEQRI